MSRLIDTINTQTPNIIETGLARCVGEPRDRHGLEGKIIDQSYRFERCEDGRGRYCRIFPDVSFPDYYETCGDVVSAGYFEPVAAEDRND